MSSECGSDRENSDHDSDHGSDSEQKQGAPKHTIKPYDSDLKRDVLYKNVAAPISAHLPVAQIQEITQHVLQAIGQRPSQGKLDNTARRETIFQCLYFLDLFQQDLSGYQLALLLGYRGAAKGGNKRVAGMGKYSLLGLVQFTTTDSIKLHKGFVFTNSQDSVPQPKPKRARKEDPKKPPTVQDFMIQKVHWIQDTDLFAYFISVTHGIIMAINLDDLRKKERLFGVYETLAMEFFRLIQLSDIGNKSVCNDLVVKGASKFSDLYYLNMISKCEAINTKFQRYALFFSNLKEEFTAAGMEETHCVLRILDEYRQRGISLKTITQYIETLGKAPVPTSNDGGSKRPTKASTVKVVKPEHEISSPFENQRMWEEVFGYHPEGLQTAGIKDWFSNFMRHLATQSSSAPSEEQKYIVTSQEPLTQWVEWLSPDQKKQLNLIIVGRAMRYAMDVFEKKTTVVDGSFVSVDWSECYGWGGNDEVAKEFAKIAFHIENQPYALMPDASWQVIRNYVSVNALAIIREAPKLFFSTTPGKDVFKRMGAWFPDVGDQHTYFRCHALVQEIVACFITSMKGVPEKQFAVFNTVYNFLVKDMKSKETWESEKPVCPSWGDLQKTLSPPVPTSGYQLMVVTGVVADNFFVDYIVKKLLPTGDVMIATRARGIQILGAGPFYAIKKDFLPFYALGETRINMDDYVRGVTPELKDAVESFTKFLYSVQPGDHQELIRGLAAQFPIEMCHRLARLCGYGTDNADKWQLLKEVLVIQDVKSTDLFTKCCEHSEWNDFHTNILKGRTVQWYDIILFAQGIKYISYLNKVSNPLCMNWDPANTPHIPLNIDEKYFVANSDCQAIMTFTWKNSGAS